MIYVEKMIKTTVMRGMIIKNHLIILDQQIFIYLKELN
jgi:hypothetical protein